MKKSTQQLLIIISAVFLLLLVIGLASYFILGRQESVSQTVQVDTQPTVVNTEPINEEQLATAKTILNYFWNNSRFEESGLYASAVECTDDECTYASSTTNHPILIWARHQYVQATGDQEELQRLQTDIDSFYNTFLDPNMPYRTSAFGCAVFMEVKNASTYLSEEHKNKLQELCRRSVFSAEVNSYYGKIFGLDDGISAEQLDPILNQLLTPIIGETSGDKVNDYLTKASMHMQFLPQTSTTYINSFNCGAQNMLPIVGGSCDAYRARSTPAHIYEERYSYLLTNQLTKSQLGFQPHFLQSMSSQPDFTLEEKALLIDGLLYYFTHNYDQEFALGKNCLLRQGLRQFASRTNDKALSTKVNQFIAPENYFVFNDRLTINSNYLTSLFECAFAESDQSSPELVTATNRAWQTWQDQPDYVIDGLFAQPVQVGSGFEVPTITNSIIAGTLAKVNQR